MILKIPLLYNNLLKQFYWILLFFFMVLTSCKNDEAQMSFVNQAYSIPNNFTETDSKGFIINEDSDDWRISPVYIGLVEVRPIFPNPVQYGSSVSLEVNFKGTVYNSRIELVYLSQSNEWYTLEAKDSTNDFDLIHFIIDSYKFGNTGEQARGIHRLLLLDGNQRLITYGDLLIQ